MKFNFNNFTLKEIIIYYYIAIVILNLFFLISFVFFMKNSFDFFQAEKVFTFNYISNIIKTPNIFIDFLLSWFSKIVYGYILFIIILTVLKKIVNNIKLYDILEGLFKKEELNPILCRKIVSHFRYNHTLNLKTFSIYNNDSIKELNFIKYHHKKNKLPLFFESNDKHYKEDSEY